MRAAGAATIFFDLHLNDRIGTTRAPADPATIEGKAKKLFDFAVAGHRLQHPVDRRERALRRTDADSLERDERPVPGERAALLQDLAALGATPAITIANPPYTGGEARGLVARRPRRPRS